MKTLLIAAGTIVGLLCVLLLAYLALIEVGQEVVVLRTTSPDGTVKSTRLWIVRHDNAEWLHSAGREWVKRFEGDSVVELERGGKVERYRGKPVPGPHPAIDRALREKYGLADRMVRYLAPCGEGVVPVRLEPVPQ